jgi:pyruvate,water dikinase
MLEKNSDIFFLHKFEIKNLAAEKCDEKKIANLILLIKKRREEFFKYEHSVPPKFLRGSREFDDKIQPKKDLKIFQGIPASQGIKTAPVRIIRTIEQITEAQEGEILIVPRTDPGWTPIFSRIGGLITETGGVLSHGAVVSREYGIPAVTNVPNACQMFKTGQIVSINGYNGTIILNKDL